MKVFRCDRCKEFEITDGSYRSKRTQHTSTITIRNLDKGEPDEYRIFDKELCDNCTTELNSFLNTAPPKEIAK